MNKLSKRIINNKFVETCFPKNLEDIILYQKDIRKQLGIQLPEKVLEYLHYFNGISVNGAHIFGINNQQDFFIDIIDANHTLKAKDQIILGHNMFSNLAFDSIKNDFIIYDKETKNVAQRYDNLEDAIICLLEL